jgi:hypothetical protein
MPHHENLVEDVLVKTKSRKSHKKCCDSSKDTCNVKCCVPDCNPDCCTAAFQRLDKLRMEWLLVQNNMLNPPTSVNNRASNNVVVNADPSGNIVGQLTQTAMGFVNTVRYLNFEECGKLDQVVGWYVDVQSGNLWFYQDLPELGLVGAAGDVPTNGDQRAVFLNTPVDATTPQDRRKLAEMEPFWKLSLRAIERVRENPKTEGNICEVKDKCGNRFLVAINRGLSQNQASVCDYNSTYSIVAVKLC